MIPLAEAVFLTLMDSVMLIGIIIGSIGVPALMVYKQFRVSGKVTLAVLATVAVNATAHALKSLLLL